MILLSAWGYCKGRLTSGAWFSRVPELVLVYVVLKAQSDLRTVGLLLGSMRNAGSCRAGLGLRGAERGLT